MNVLLLSHQLDFSGAPIALLRLAETLIAQGHSVSLLSLKNGPLGADFGKLGVKQFSTAEAQHYDLYFANTFLTVPLALKLAPSAEKITAWIHESRNFFRLYGIDEKQFELSKLKYALFPSKFMLDEYRDLMPSCELGQLRNLVSMDEIKRFTIYQDFFSVTGAWEPRKNQIALVNLLERNKCGVKLNFIGAEKPKDFAPSQHNFFGQLPMTKAKELIASSFGLISAAQSETQNLAAIESILSNNPVLLSDIPAHRELKQLIPDIVLFDVHDSSSFLKGLEEIFIQKKNITLLDRSRKAADNYFGRLAFRKAIQTHIF